ncbi:alkylation response protein AidB-like acyl-CoA dehydrogenase [Ruminiclostridium sufflavum DSM 19573]|uniref:Alkylation response protein AidB-like acyl-CoA dehydrogenase n=1 Tax=Ruminiclostridium sufflavum DSM 19573 TaxID=1121337 RepID=A0A318XPG5_9FIRM|nr:acyl-CoA dehydrogenase family protein [Ruminiclostridium sufflavum]PYG90236.1 alkylation response protein AidB-like acyl-CoA dehydrogenase [Ruminiclostridium sufflavum DSM 19573]
MDNEKLKGLLAYISENISSWNEQKYIPRDGWLTFGKQGVIGVSMDREQGIKAFSELIAGFCRFKNVGLISSFSVNEIALTLLARFNSPQAAAAKAEVLEGRKNISMCITEEGAGSDVSAIAAEAAAVDNGFVLSGKKTMISNGPIADYFIVAVKTNKEVAAWRGISLFLIKKDDPGLKVSPALLKAGAHLMPLGEIEFENLKLTEERLLGKRNRGFEHLMSVLIFERTVISIMSTAMSEDALDSVMGYLSEREVFGKKLRDYQNTKMVMADLFSRARIMRVFVNNIMDDFDSGIMDKTDVIIGKIMASELLKDIIDALYRLYGARGYLASHWIANYYNDVRWINAGGGSNELLKDVLGNNIVHGGS